MSGPFGLPDDVTDAAGVLRWAIVMEGRGDASAGALVLAEWVLADQARAARAFGEPMCPINGRNVLRLLAGAVLPGDDWAEWLGRATGGLVQKVDFQRRADVEAAYDRADDSREGRPAETVATAPELLCAIPGLIGETPSGPLFRTIIDPLHPRQFVVAGLGQATVFDTSRGQAMLDAVATGLAMVRQ